MLPYVVWKNGEEKKYCVVAKDSHRAKQLTALHLSKEAILPFDWLSVRPASEDDMRNRAQAYYPDRNYWEQYLHMKLKNKEGVICSYYY